MKAGQIVIIYHPLKNIRLIKRVKIVGKNSIEVLGDNIEYSNDSNKFGLINNEKVIGIVTSKIKKIF
ncbi:S26 family signal peptidase [Prochlorococcus sp. MED1]|uniref:S26 family signal peptidase n=1 Tax=Prochlorococcus sp. MED1 TaxID=3082519 RepID=UPI0039B50E1B